MNRTGGTRRCVICRTFIREGVVCPEHRTAVDEQTRLRGAMRTVEELRLEDMSVPDVYQRELKEHRVRRIIREFDPDLLGLLVVAREGEHVWILDGQHRWLALVGRGEETALCEVLHDVSISRQAHIFSGRNSRRLSPHPRDGFRADYVAGQQQALAVMDVVARHGYYEPFAGKASANRFVCVSALREVHEWGVLEPAVTLIREAWPADELATQAPILTGLAALLRLYPEVPRRELTGRLARHSAAEVLRLARAEQANSRDRRLWAHVAAVVVGLYNHGRTAAYRLPAAEIPYDATRRWKAVRDA